MTQTATEKTRAYRLTARQAKTIRTALLHYADHAGSFVLRLDNGPTRDELARIAEEARDARRVMAPQNGTA